MAKLPKILLASAKAVLGLALLLAVCAPVHALEPTEPLKSDKRVLLQAATSLDDSGLLPHLAARLAADTGIELLVVAVGSGQAIANARRGDADLLLTHDPQRELEFMREGSGERRYQLFRNDFIIVGPDNDPAGLRSAAQAGQDARAAFWRISEAGAKFVSRGDQSGTHIKELAIRAALAKRGDVFAPILLDIGAGQGTALNVAAQKQAYTLTDWATFMAYSARQKASGLSALYGHLEHPKDKDLNNTYSLILVTGGARRKAALQAYEWFVSQKGQDAIYSFRIGSKAPFKRVAGQR